MIRSFHMVGAAALLMAAGLAAQAQDPVANLELTNPNNFNVTVVDPANNQVTPVNGLGLQRNSTVTWLGGDPVRVVYPNCYIQLPTFQGITPAATPCCPGTLTQLTSVTVDENCSAPGAVPLVAGAGAGAVPYILAALAAGGIAWAIIANADDDDEEAPLPPAPPPVSP